SAPRVEPRTALRDSRIIVGAAGARQGGGPIQPKPNRSHVARSEPATRGGLKQSGAAGSTCSPASLRHVSAHQRQELFGGVRVALLDGGQDVRDIAHDPQDNGGHAARQMYFWFSIGRRLMVGQTFLSVRSISAECRRPNTGRQECPPHRPTS